MTLIETLVAISIVGLLIALTLPAVMAARESASRAQCQNNLRQFGIALHGYHADYGCFPTAVTNRQISKGEFYLGLYSVHCRLLPYLEQRPLFNSINFQFGTWPSDAFKVGGRSEWVEWNLHNATARTTQVGLFLCPSDDGAFWETGNNYRGNAGVGPAFSAWIETPDSGNGIFPEIGTVTAGRVLDGLSHTVAFSERVRGSGELPLDPERDAFWRLGIANTADQILGACRIMARPANRNDGFVFSGRWWFWTGREWTLFNHAQTPNGLVPDCTAGGAMPAIDMFTARSHHPGGVNALMADGSLRFVSETISVPVWRGLGTRNGGELFD